MFNKPIKIKSNSTTKGADKLVNKNVLRCCVHTLHFIRKKLQKKLVQMFPTITEAAVGSMVPTKMAVQTVKLVTHSEQTMLAYLVDGEPLFVDHNGLIFPTGQEL